MDELGKAIIEKRDIRSDNMLAKHADWADEVIARHANINTENVDKILKDEIGIVFSKVLEHAGVFKRDDEGKKAFVRFVKTVG